MQPTMMQADADALSSGISAVAARVTGFEDAQIVRLLAFVVAFAIGLAAACFAAWQLAISFHSLDELHLVEFALSTFAAISTVAFASICWKGGSERTLAIAALAMAVAALMFSGFPRWMDAVDALQTNPYPDSARDAQIVLEFLVPALIAELIIWRLALREWRNSRGADARTPWPWFTIAFGAGLIFNPLGLELLSSAIRQSPSDWFAPFCLKVSIGAAVLLLILGWIEHAFRARILRHSSVQAEA
jgi:hypothetical protein